MEIRQPIRGKEAREKILAGVKEAFDTVKKTLGPGGKNALVERGLRAPRITNDGKFIAKNIELADEYENIALKSFVASAEETDKKGGDGTTSTMVIAGNIIKNCFDKMGDFDTVITQTAREMQKEINEVCAQVVEKVRKKAKKINSVEELAKVTTISVEDEKLGHMIAEMAMEVGKDGFIDTVEGHNGEIEHEVIKGMKVQGKFGARAFVNNGNRRTMEVEDCPVVITNAKLEKFSDFLNVLDQMYKAGHRKLLVLAHNYSEDFLVQALRFIKQTQFQVFCAKAPSLTSWEWDDIAVYTEAHHFNEQKGELIENFQMSNLGHIGRAVIDEDDVVLTGGNGDVESRVKELKNELKAEKDEAFRNRMKRRIGALSSGVGVIRVDAASEVEAGYIKLKVEDGTYAAKAALEEGYVPGGGSTLKEIAEEMDENILTEALKSPYLQIEENNGKIEITDDIVDPAKVVRLAVENACSVAGTLITTDSIIAQKRDRSEYEGLHEISDILSGEDGIKITK